MQRIFGFDLGVTSIGSAVVNHDETSDRGNILHLGVRIFPEARDPKGLEPTNQRRRQKRQMRRQLRRRKQRRRRLNETLAELGLLPAYKSCDWKRLMNTDPFGLRAKGVQQALSAHELGRALSHLAKRRHFKARDEEEIANEADDPSQASEPDAEEKQAQKQRDSDLADLKTSGLTPGAWLASRDPLQERRRGVHLTRAVVEAEFDKLIQTQRAYHAVLQDERTVEALRQTIFFQRPVFWRLSTLGQCRFVPDAPLCPKGSWLSQQRRMLEQVNNLRVEGGNVRPLEQDERAAILQALQTRPKLTWSQVKKALAPLFKERGDPGAEKKLRFNLEASAKSLLGNGLEAKLVTIFGESWPTHPHRDAIRLTVHDRLWRADYGVIGKQRVVIQDAATRQADRRAAVEAMRADYGLDESQAEALAALQVAPGWEPFSTAALEQFLPMLEQGHRMGELLNGVEFEDWRNETFPDRERPTGELFDQLPSPRDRDEAERLKSIRNPTVLRVQNELRKVVNNLIREYGKPDLIRIELTRDIGLSKREREHRTKGIRDFEKRRDAARKWLEERHFKTSHDNITKWLLWDESQHRCPYTGDVIGCDDLFNNAAYEIEHILPRSRSFDDSFGNKTLCRKQINKEKGNRTPFEYFKSRPEDWEAVKARVLKLQASRPGADGMPRGKVKRFLAETIPEGFSERQLNDTGYAARLAMSQLKRLWPDVGPAAPVHVRAISGKVTGKLRHLWGLNTVLSDDDKKSRDDHRHHAIDALVVALTGDGMTNKLSRYFQSEDDPRVLKPDIPMPWPNLRDETKAKLDALTVSHRVRKKITGQLHLETNYGDTGNDIRTKSGVYREYAFRKPIEAMKPGEIGRIRDDAVRDAVEHWAANGAGKSKSSETAYPRLNSAIPIKKARLLHRQSADLMTTLPSGSTDPGDNHHIAIFRLPNGKAHFEIVSLFEAARRAGCGLPVVKRELAIDARFIMSLSPGDALQFSEGDKAGIWIVQGVWASGQIVMHGHQDATGATVWRPTVTRVTSDRAQKVSIDPIGRIRKAHD